MNILLLSREFPPGPHGGIGSFNLELATGLAARGHHVIVLTTSGHHETQRQYPFTVIAMPPPVPRMLRLIAPVNWYVYARAVSRFTSDIVDKFGIDIIEAPSWGCESLVYSRQSSRPPVIIRLHGLQGRRPIPESARDFVRQLDTQGTFWKVAGRRIERSVAFPILWRMERRSLEQAEELIAPSAFMRDFVSGLVPTVSDRIHQIPNGVNIEKQAVTSVVDSWQWYTAQYGGDKDDLVVLFVGRINAYKGADVLAETVSSVISQVPNARFVFAGPVVDRSIVEAIENQPQVRKHVVFTGRIPRQSLFNLYAVCATVVLPTLYEVSPMAILEGMSFGQPIIATGIGPIPELVQNRRTGLLVEPCAPKALERALVELLLDGRKRRQMGNLALQSVGENYSIDDQIDKTVALYRQVLADQVLPA